MSYQHRSTVRNAAGENTHDILNKMTHDERLDLYKKVVEIKNFADTLPSSQKSLAYIQKSLAELMIDYFIAEQDQRRADATTKKPAKRS